jgi:hypothetical protein
MTIHRQQLCPILSRNQQRVDVLTREYKRGKYHCTVHLLFDWFGISCMTTGNFCFYLQSRLIQTSKTGGQCYTDTYPFSILCTDKKYISEYTKTCEIRSPRTLSTMAISITAISIMTLSIMGLFVTLSINVILHK